MEQQNPRPCRLLLLHATWFDHTLFTAQNPGEMMVEKLSGTVAVQFIMHQWEIITLEVMKQQRGFQTLRETKHHFHSLNAKQFIHDKWHLEKKKNHPSPAFHIPLLSHHFSQCSTSPVCVYFTTIAHTLSHSDCLSRVEVFNTPAPVRQAKQHGVPYSVTAEPLRVACCNLSVNSECFPSVPPSTVSSVHLA